MISNQSVELTNILGVLAWKIYFVNFAWALIELNIENHSKYYLHILKIAWADCIVKTNSVLNS